MTTLKVFEHFDIEETIAYSKIPWITVRAMVKPPFKDDAPAGEKEVDKAKARRYRWQECGDGEFWDKCWIKQIKENELLTEELEAPFAVVRLEKT